MEGRVLFQKVWRGGAVFWSHGEATCVLHVLRWETQEPPVRASRPCVEREWGYTLQSTTSTTTHHRLHHLPHLAETSGAHHARLGNRSQLGQGNISQCWIILSSWWILGRRWVGSSGGSGPLMNAALCPWTR